MVDAQRRIDRWVQKNAKGLQRSLREQIAAKALDRWCAESDGRAPELYASDEIKSATRKDSRGLRKHQREQTNEKALTVKADDRLSALERLEAKGEAIALFERDLYFTEENLWRATQRVCERRFRGLIGIEWRALPSWAVEVLNATQSLESHEVEKRAEHALLALQQAIGKLAEIAALGPGRGGVRAHFARMLAKAAKSEPWDVVTSANVRDPALDIGAPSLGVVRQHVAYWWPEVKTGLKMKAKLKIPLAEFGALFRSQQWFRDPRRTAAFASPKEKLPAPAQVTPTELAVVAILLGDRADGMDRDWTKGTSPAQVIESVKAGFAGKWGAMAKVKALDQSLAGMLAVAVEKKR